MTTEMIQNLNKAKQELAAAKARKSGVQAAKEKMKNLLFNYADDLLNLAAVNQKLVSENQALETALDEVDKENDELREKIKAMEGKQKKGNAENAEG